MAEISATALFGFEGKGYMMIMYNFSVAELFMLAAQRKAVPHLDALFRYNAIMCSPLVKCIAFVEGIDDLIFYQGCLYKECHLLEEEVFLICRSYEAGKTSVIDMMRYIRENSRIPLGKRVHFIIDHDYDGTSHLDLTDREEKVITMLPCYSFENYYFYSENLETVFKKMVSKQDPGKALVLFQSVLENYTSALYDYCICKKVAVKHGFIGSMLNDQMENELMKVDFRHSDLISVQTMKAMESRLEMWKDQLNAFGKKEYEIEYRTTSNKLMFMKGKLLFHFLTRYLAYELTTNDNIDCYGDQDLEGERYKRSRDNAHTIFRIIYSGDIIMVSREGLNEWIKSQLLQLSKKMIINLQMGEGLVEHTG